ncbi:MAG: hypothetical protein GWP56_12205 [Gammaproteobacteria bacterium]|nr:hypothetical protein [Gammaproteobacteria bacterium]
MNYRHAIIAAAGEVGGHLHWIAIEATGRHLVLVLHIARSQVQSRHEPDTKYQQVMDWSCCASHFDFREPSGILFTFSIQTIQT